MHCEFVRAPTEWTGSKSRLSPNNLVYSRASDPAASVVANSVIRKRCAN